VHAGRFVPHLRVRQSESSCKLSCSSASPLCSTPAIAATLGAPSSRGDWCFFAAGAPMLQSTDVAAPACGRDLQVPLTLI
jgi:hypothetical protein